MNSFLSRKCRKIMSVVVLPLLLVLAMSLFTHVIWAVCNDEENCLNSIQSESDKQNIQLTPERILERRRIRDLQLSPDKMKIAMVVTEPLQGTEFMRNIWIYDVATRETKRMTTCTRSDDYPRWSPSGQSLAYISNRSGTREILLLPLGGGEAETLTQSRTGVRAFEWAPDGSKIAFLSSDPETEEEIRKRDEKDDAFIVGSNFKDPRLRVLDVKSRKIQTLTLEKWRVAQFVWLPQSDRLLILATNDPRRDVYTFRLYLLNSNTKDLMEIDTPPGSIFQMKISRDGKTLSYLGSRPPDHGPVARDLYIRPLKGGEARNLTAASIDRQISKFVWREDGNFLVLAKTGFKSSFFNVDKNGLAIKLSEFAVNPADYFVVSEKWLAFAGDNATQATELWISKKPGSGEKVTQFNKNWDDVILAKPEFFTYSSFDGKKIEAALIKPRGHKVGVRVPLVAIIHGGPTARFGDRFLYRMSTEWAQLLAEQGYAVFMPNIRGSTGYGIEFAAACRYDWGGGDWKDVMAGVDYLIEQGIADADRLGIGGWSYGGYMGAWAVTQTDRFRAIVAGSPMTDLAVEYGTENHSANIYDTWFLGSPYENLDLFIDRSPLTHVKNARTPILLMLGENDPINPIAQCNQFLRGLKRYNVETDFVVYPRELHPVRERKHKLDVLRRMLDWFNKYLNINREE